MENEQFSAEALNQNYLILKEIVENGLNQAFSAENLREAKGILIEVQGQFKGLKLFREAREELYNRLQLAFQIINQKIDDEKLEFELETLANYEKLKPMAEKIAETVDQQNDSRETWAKLIDLQTLIKSKKLKREQREELLKLLQDAFTLIKLQRDDEHKIFEKEAVTTYGKLKAMVDEGLKLAEETHEYKETREFLKKIQSEFKGAKMISEQREELYSRLQTAFDVLGKRLDDFFHNKKKNWETKMNFTVSRFEVDIFEMQQAIIKEKEDLEELLDQMDILETSGKNAIGKMALQSRIGSLKRSIEQKTNQILQLQTNRDELKARLE
ncbi:MAG: hypothetical protein WCP32_08180 [Bacteroidota bacterium]